MDITGATAVVTGAASGLGLKTSQALVERGAHVIGIDLAASIEKLSDTRHEKLLLVPADVTSESEVLAALGLINSAYPLRIVVNCAGIAPGARTIGKSGPHPLDLFRRTIEINLIGTFNVLRLAAQKMVEESEPVEGDGARGIIVNTASVAAYEGQIGQVAYAASKSGIVGLTITSARDLARYGIRVNTIAPGIVDTPMLAGLPQEVRESLYQNVPFPHRLATADEYAELVCFLVEHNYINGETVRMDAALRMAPQ